MGYIRPIQYAVCKKCKLPRCLGMWGYIGKQCPSCESKEVKPLSQADARRAYFEHFENQEEQ
jgi:hypothetical protein